MTRRAKLPCPVCPKTFANLGGLNSHLKVSKDSAHAAHRAQPKAPTDPAPLADPTPAPQQEAKGPVQVTFSPASAGPLLPPEEKASSAIVPAAPKAPAAQAKPGALAIAPGTLAPVINGGVAAMCNGFFLRGKGDGQVSPAEVGDTGFGEAVERAVRFYFPDLPWDHPAVVLFVSSAGLAGVVASKKAPKSPADKAKEQAQREAKPRDAADVPDKDDSKPEAEPAPPAAEPLDPYWVGIQAAAGGAPKVMEVESLD